MGCAELDLEFLQNAANADLEWEEKRACQLRERKKTEYAHGKRFALAGMPGKEGKLITGSERFKSALKHDLLDQPVTPVKVDMVALREKRERAAHKRRVHTGTEVMSKKEKRYIREFTRAPGHFSKKRKEMTLLQMAARYKRDGTLPELGPGGKPIVVYQHQLDDLKAEGLDVRALTQMIKVGLQRGCVELDPGPKFGTTITLRCRKTGGLFNCKYQKKLQLCPMCNANVFFLPDQRIMMHEIVESVTNDYEIFEPADGGGPSTIADAANLSKEQKRALKGKEKVKEELPEAATAPCTVEHPVRRREKGGKPPLKGGAGVAPKGEPDGEKPEPPRELLDGERAPQAVLDEIVRSVFYGDPKTIVVREARYNTTERDGLLSERVVKRVEADFIVVEVQYEAFSDLVINMRLGMVFQYIYSILAFTNLELLSGVFNAYRVALVMFILGGTFWGLSLWFRAISVLTIFPGILRTIAKPLLGLMRSRVFWKTFRFVYIPHFYSSARAAMNPRSSRDTANDLVHRILREEANFPLPATKSEWRHNTDLVACYSFEAGSVFQRNADVSGLIYDDIYPSGHHRNPTFGGAQSSAEEKYTRLDFATVKHLYKRFHHKMTKSSRAAKKPMKELKTFASYLMEASQDSPPSAQTAKIKKPLSKGSGSGSSGQRKKQTQSDSESSAPSSDPMFERIIELHDGYPVMIGLPPPPTHKPGKPSSPKPTPGAWEPILQ